MKIRIELAQDANPKYREDMEDFSVHVPSYLDAANCPFVAIYDGHGGTNAAEWCSRNLHVLLSHRLQEHRENIKNELWIQENIPSLIDSVFADCQSQISALGMLSGCTVACVVLIPTEDDAWNLICANVGDTRVVLMKSAEEVSELTQTHLPSLRWERDRVRLDGGFIVCNRVNGVLAVTRALGDAALGSAVSCRPFVRIQRVDSTCTIVVASDGLWDVCEFSKLSEMRPTISAQKLVAYAMDNYTADNVSVACIQILE